LTGNRIDPVSAETEPSSNSVKYFDVSHVTVTTQNAKSFRQTHATNLVHFPVVRTNRAVANHREVVVDLMINEPSEIAIRKNLGRHAGLLSNLAYRGFFE